MTQYRRTQIGRFRYIASRAERRHFGRNSVWAFNVAPVFPCGALTLHPQLCMGISPKRCTEIGLLQGPTADNSSSAAYSLKPTIRGLHLFTAQLNLSRFGHNSP